MPRDPNTCLTQKSSFEVSGIVSSNVILVCQRLLRAAVTALTGSNVNLKKNDDVMNRKFKSFSIFFLVLMVGGVVWVALQYNWVIKSKPHPSSLTIERKGKLQQVKQEPPTLYHVDDSQLTQKIYAALLELNPVPNGEYHCPIDFGISYDMSFYENGKKVFFANANGGGCQIIHIQGKNGSFRSTDSSFWKLLQEATGMNPQQLRGGPGSF